MLTESTLRDWRFGQVQAERLTAALLHLEGYSDVDPQHPLGGRDGLKDVLCRRGGRQFIAGAYFPTTRPSAATVTKKFNDDFAGVARNGADGFCFFVNQSIPLRQRTELRSSRGNVAVEIYHLERMRALLDSPQGCGARLEYLRIVMTEEEQLAFWSSSNLRLSDQLARLETLQRETYDAVLQSADSVVSRTNLMLHDLREHVSSTRQPEYEKLAVPGGFPTSNLDASVVCWLHRLIMSNQAASAIVRSASGQLRNSNVWVGGTREGAPTYTPPTPEEVPQLVDAWAKSWRDNYADLMVEVDDVRKIESLAGFYYEFLRIHPFLDGNGRVADVLLDQAARELLQRTALEGLSSNRTELYVALFAANSGDFTPLRERIAAILF